jgi:hypothetical protein
MSKRQSACISDCNELVWPSSGVKMMDCFHGEDCCFISRLYTDIIMIQKQSQDIEQIVLLDFIPHLVSQKIEELKIYTKYHNTHVHKIHTRVNY